MTDAPPNIILLSFDALRADHCSWDGYHRETTPELDAFAEECLRFEAAYSASSHTREAVPALLTGRYPDDAIDASYHLGATSVAETLSEAGYATAGFHSNPFVSRAYGFGAGFDTLDDDLHLGSNKLIALAQRWLDKLRNRHYARSEEINDCSLAWFDDTDRAFLWNHYMDTHGPYEPPGAYRTLYTDREVSDGEAQSLYQRAIGDPDSITDDERQVLIDYYDAEIRYNDERVGQFLEALRERGVLDESLVIVTADHGDAFGEHGYYEHPRYLHEDITRVPMLVRPPGGADRTVDEPVSTLDVVATITEAIGRESSGPGQSLLGEIDADRRVFSQARGEAESSHLRRFAVRSRAGEAFGEFDTDRESVTITESASEDLREALREHIESRSGVVASASGEDEVDEEIERRLSALGYTE